MTLFDDIRASADYEALLTVSERLGRDPFQVQGPGGNSSIKRGGAMWVKASGTWLAQARERDIMVPVDAAAMVAALGRDDPSARDAASFMVASANRTGLRGSIETSVHALLDWPVVLHTHCVATIAAAIRDDAEAIVARRLSGLDAVFIPYARPGHDLARAIAARITPATRVLVLGNHGLVACGESAAEAAALLARVSARLVPAAVAPPMPASPALAVRINRTGWIVAPDPSTHALARDPARLAMARGSTLYPDHLVFLGPGVAVAREGESPGDASTRGGGPPRKLILFPGEGAAIPADATPALRAMARCLGDVIARVEPGAPLRRLTAEQEGALLDWDAEKHRQALNAKTP